MTDKSDDEQRIYDHAQIAFKKLEVKDGDIVTVTFPGDILAAQMEAFAQYMESAIPDGITVFCTRDNVTMDRLPKEELNRLGWYNFNDSSKGEDQQH